MKNFVTKHSNIITKQICQSALHALCNVSADSKFQTNGKETCEGDFKS